jgi:glycosyltransferase involved in cell wall biosynthesis
VNQLSQRLAPYFKRTEIISVRGDAIPSKNGIDVININPVWWGKLWGWSPKLKHKIDSLAKISNDLIVHVHGIWMAPQWLGANMAAKNNIPFVLSTHGMMAPALWNYRGMFQKLKNSSYWHLLAHKQFKYAHIIHAITREERDLLAVHFDKSRIEIIPNSIDLSAVDRESVRSNESPQPYILFIGRIHPIKGIEFLLKGFCEAKLPSPWKIIVAGPEWSPSYGTVLQKLSEKLGIASQVEFIGPVYGKEKWELIKKAWIVAVLSKSEVISMVNLESAACYTPSLTTRETGLFDWEEGGGEIVDLDISNIANKIRTISFWPESERISRGQASRRLVEKRYSWDVVLPLWVDLYRSLSR